MGNLNITELGQWLATRGADFGLKIIAAIAAWIVGRWIIGFALKLVGRAIGKSGKIEPTLARYLVSIIGVLLNIVLILAILDIFGVQTTSFAALLAGAGLAIGTAWGGLLAHFAAGIFMQVLRPFKVGDFVSAGGVEGTVVELGLFGTTVVSGDNVTHVIGNNKVFGDSIKNYSALPHRRVDCEAKIANSVDVNDAIARLKAALPTIKNVKTEPAPEVEISKFTAEGPLLTVRGYAHTDHYWQVYFDINKMIAHEFGKAGYPVPELAQVQRAV
ncbi:MAG: mechanosensitive ion channel family protein [Burkholderiales bacterium]|nr:MAG: mechanosensitive ion channel family protein [Burkholderiales bacterium]